MTAAARPPRWGSGQPAPPRDLAAGTRTAGPAPTQQRPPVHLAAGSSAAGAARVGAAAPP
ncbi:hypothetical protein DMT42_28390 [Streptomyces actuosus]|uniref:Uncharacterized protein n=1 Tax=Streptomyces actuosus TaxID=1885 RepID=A0A2U9P9Q3_STRAS|nr:hypothetical protein DMT42_28390 [Streptomyces actuosus]